MKAVIQRVDSARVEVESAVTGLIQKGLLIYLGIGRDDTESDIDPLINKIIHLRIFEDTRQKMNLSVQDIKGSILVVSQFTLYGDVKKGTRPNFQDAAPPDKAEGLYDLFIQKLKQTDIRVETGLFRAMMKVYSVNDGPVTIIIS